MYCIKCGKEIEDDVFTGVCPFCGSNQKIKKTLATRIQTILYNSIEGIKKFTLFVQSGKIKNFILSIGRVLCDIDTCLWLGSVIIFAIVLWMGVLGSLLLEDGYFKNVGYSPIFLILSIILPIIFLIFVVVIRYLLYILIDIKEGINKLVEQNKEEKNA